MHRRLRRRVRLLQVTAATDEPHAGSAPRRRIPPRPGVPIGGERPFGVGRVAWAVRRTSPHEARGARNAARPRTLNRRGIRGQQASARRVLGAPDELDPVREDVGTVRGPADMERLDGLVTAARGGRTVHPVREGVDEHGL